MITFTLKTESLSTNKRFKIILDIYKSFLKDDDSWHFFYEEEQGDLLRVSDKLLTLNHIREYLRNAGIDFSWKDEWIDGNFPVEKFKDEFTSIFHSNSVLAMKLLNEDDDFECFRLLRPILDRIVHSFTNNCTAVAKTYITMSEAFGFPKGCWESVLIHELGMGRSFYSGYRQRFLEEAERQKNNNDKHIS